MQYKDGAALSYPKIEYTYNADGMITGVRHCYYINGSTEYYYDSEYIVDGTRVLAYRGGDDRGSFYAEYLYDESGSPMGMKYYAYNFETNQTETTCAYYFFEKNIFGDIVGVYDEDGNKVLGFTYDAWGNFSVTETSEISGLYEGYRTFLTKACIFRYRGYMYESSSELYYLQTRFYDPVVGRFINADGYVSTGTELLSYNMYAYCYNNPVNYMDPSGNIPLLIIPIIPVIVVIVVAVVIAVNIPSKEEHYSRNEKNLIPADEELQSIVDGQNETWEPVPDKYNAYHRFTNGTQGDEAIYNKKYMTKDGTGEVIICYDPQNVVTPYRVTDPNNIGTYNYGPGNGIDHFLKDVLPYWIYGNSTEDTTSIWDRIFGN